MTGNLRSGICAAAAVPHAPQMLSLPASEDAAQVGRVRAAMQGLGSALRALEPDLVIVIGNDHGDDFILRSVPAFMVHCGPVAEGRDGHAGRWRLDGEAGYRLLEGLQQEGFDPAFTLDAPLGTYFTIPVEFMGWNRDTPILPLFVNSYVPPQPSGLRCHAFGQALQRVLERQGRRAVLIASGGLSHYPGTAAYRDPGPDLATDRQIFEACRSGNLLHLLSLDDPEMDRSGNIELRSWQILAGAVGQARPDIALLEPNWHHTYAVLGWTALGPSSRTAPLFYERIPSARVELARALHSLRTDAAACRAFIDSPDSFADRFALQAEERALLIAMDEAALRDRCGVHALLTSGAVRRLQAVRRETTRGDS
jgi:2,3-dihydroxyphenylpropionate 1,2-dioxygenase